MFTKLNIIKLTLGIHKNDYEKVLNLLGDLEKIHIVEDQWDVKDVKKYITNHLSNSDIIVKINSILSELDVAAVETKIQEEKNIHVDVDSYEDDMELVESILSEIKINREAKNKLTLRLDELKSRVDEARKMKVIYENLEIIENMKICSCAVGTVAVPIEMNNPLNSTSFYVRQFGTYILGISLADDYDLMLHYLKQFGYEDRLGKISSSKNLLQLKDYIFDDIEMIKVSLRKNEKSFEDLKGKWIHKLETLYNYYISLRKFDETKGMLLRSKEIVFINGWIVKEDLNKINSLLRNNCHNGFVSLVASSESYSQDDIPVALKNNKFFRAFELLVKNAGIPSTIEKDPTPLASIAFVIMFGMMFGDIGQGIVLVLTGIIMKYLSVKKSLSQNISDGAVILMTCGTSASFFGVLYGSVFSYEHITPLWFHPMDNMMDLFFAAIMLGVVLISLGLIMNIVNSYSSGFKTEALFGTKGIAGLYIYIGSLVLFIRYLKLNIFPQFYELIVVLVIPLFIFLLRNILGYFFLKMKNPFPHGIFEYIVESIVEIIEMFSSFLGNTISFIRAGAFALSHAGLSIAIYTLAKIVNPEIISIGSLSIIIIGNIFIILLEGLLCSIQSMRLEYYEFFGKFFKGDGKEFQPFSLNKKYFALEARK